MSARRPKRTRDRILDLSLGLFNALGEPNVTSSAIAEEMAISPGNLYYHFRSKQDIVNTLFERFERELLALLQEPVSPFDELEHVRRRLEAQFELMWRHRFLYRDLNELMSRNRRLETRFKELLAQQAASQQAWCESLARAGALRLDPDELTDLCANLLLITCHWLSFEYTLNARRFSEAGFAAEATGRALHRSMALLQPYRTAGSGEPTQRPNRPPAGLPLPQTALQRL